MYTEMCTCKISMCTCTQLHVHNECVHACRQGDLVSSY